MHRVWLEVTKLLLSLYQISHWALFWNSMICLYVTRCKQNHRSWDLSQVITSSLHGLLACAFLQHSSASMHVQSWTCGGWDYFRCLYSRIHIPNNSSFIIYALEQHPFATHHKLFCIYDFSSRKPAYLGEVLTNCAFVSTNTPKMTSTLSGLAFSSFSDILSNKFRFYDHKNSPSSILSDTEQTFMRHYILSCFFWA